MHQEITDKEWRETRLQMISKGIAAIKLLGSDGNPHWIDYNAIEVSINFEQQECWYRFKEENMVLPICKGWTFIPFYQLLGIQFNE